MILLPAVDIRGGRAVRLQQGDFERETVYRDDPLEAARSFVEAGARFLHLVDLDGARVGEPANLHHLERIAGELDVPVQFGGGLRSMDSLEKALDAGADRVVVGTAAYVDADFLQKAVARAGRHLAVAVDVRGGRVSVAGWSRETAMSPAQAIDRMRSAGVRRFVYTDVERDGMLGGPDADEVLRVAQAIEGDFVYSGGIASLDDLKALKALRLRKLEGVISGKALYEGRFTVAEANEVLGS